MTPEELGISEEIQAKFKEAVTAIGVVREKQDELEKRFDGVDAETQKSATEAATQALKTVEDLQKKLASYDNLEAILGERLDAIEKAVAKGGGKAEKTPNGEYAKAYNAYLRKKTVTPSEDAVTATLDGMVDLYFPKADDDTKAAVFDILQKTLTAGSGPDGGYWVPVDQQAGMIQRIFETSNLRPLATVITTGTNEISIPIDDQEAGARWANELSPPVDVNSPQVGELRIPIHELNGDIPITQHLIEDASRDVGAWTSGKAADKFRRTENTAFVVGNGDQRPKGFLSYAEAADPDVYQRDAIGILDVAAATAEGFAADDFVDLQNLLKEDFQPGAVWTMKRRTFGNVLTLKDGQGQYLLRFGDMFAVGAGKQVLGSAVSFFDDMPAVADNALAVAYGDFRAGYTIADRLGFSVMIDPFTRRPKVLWAFRKRVGGAVSNWDAIKLLRTNVI